MAEKSQLLISATFVPTLLAATLLLGCKESSAPASSPNASPTQSPNSTPASTSAPAPSPLSSTPPNLDFEQGPQNWDFTKDPGRSRVMPEAAIGGKLGLRIAEPGGRPGALVFSPPFEVKGGQGVRLTFQSRAISGRLGCGLSLRFFDAAGRLLNNENYPYDVDIVVPSAGAEKGWTTYTLESIAPEGAVRGNVHVGTWGSPVTLDVDDLRISAYEPVVAPPWTPSYKLTPEDRDKLTAADVVGPDGLVYPDWSRSGVPGGIPEARTVAGPEAFAALREADISDALEAAVRQASAAGGGAVQLPEGTFYLDRMVIVSANGIVIRGEGRDKTRILYRDRIPMGTIRLFNWAGKGMPYGPGATAEVQANPKELISLKVSAKGAVLAEQNRKMHWGNTFQVRVDGAALLQRLGPGAHEIEAAAEYADSRKFTQKFPIKVTATPVLAPAPTFDAAIVFAGRGREGDKVSLAADARRGDQKLRLAKAPAWSAGDRIRLVAPATARWNELVGNRAPWGLFRAGIYEITAVAGDEITLNQPVRIEFPAADDSYVERVSMLTGCGIEKLTLEQEIVTPNPSGKKEPLSGWYAIEDLWTNGVTFSFCFGSWMRDVRIVNAGRNPVYFPNTKFCEVRDCEFNDSLFKGGGGTAYVGFESAFDCLMDTVVTTKMRHAPDIQWASSGNVVRNCKFYNSDAQFHAGWTNENLLEGNLIVADAADAANGGYGHGIFASGPSSTEHGPEGPRNVIYNNDVIAPKDGIHMVGGNENWLIVYNRIRSGNGYSLFGREKSFDHILKGNVFIADLPKASLVYFAAPNCTGIDLLENQFYGNSSKFIRFNGGAAQLNKDEGNEIHPLAEAENAALPKPPVDSIYLWQKERAAAR